MFNTDFSASILNVYTVAVIICCRVQEFTGGFAVCHLQISSLKLSHISASDYSIFDELLRVFSCNLFKFCQWCGLFHLFCRLECVPSRQLSFLGTGSSYWQGLDLDSRKVVEAQ
jgi:hypothetical protein